MNVEQNKEWNAMEAALLSKLDHINVINLIATIEDENEITLVFPFMKSNLSSEIDATAYNKGRCKDIMRMLFSGLEYMHSLKIMHRDIKPENILVHADGDIKICDLGLAIEYSNNKTYQQECGTPSYMAAEIFLGTGYNYTVDIWVICF